jgi:hypothetical protein
MCSGVYTNGGRCGGSRRSTGMDKDEEKVQLLRKQAFVVGVVGNLVDTVL